MSYNPKQQSLEKEYFQGEYLYNYGGYVPEITPGIPPSPSPTPSITPTKTPTPTPTKTSTPTPTPSSQYALLEAENCCAPFDTITIGLLQGVSYNQDGGVVYNGNSYVIIGNGSGSPVQLYSTTTDNICSTLVCPSPTPTPTSSITPTPTTSPGSSPTPTPSITPTISVSPTRTPTPTPTISVSPTETPTMTPTPTITSTPTLTPTGTPTMTPTPSSSPVIPQPVSMTITGTGNYASFSGTWFPSQLINKDLYSTQLYPTYGYNKFRTYQATAMVFYKQGAQQMVFWKPGINPQTPCFNVGTWQFHNTFSQYPTYPVETWIGFYRPTIVQFFCAGIDVYNTLGWIPEGTYIESVGNVVVSYNY